MNMPSDVAYDAVKRELAKDLPLTLEMVGNVFGQDFWILIVYCLLDAQEAARAIQGAINRLRAGEESVETARGN